MKSFIFVSILMALPVVSSAAESDAIQSLRKLGLHEYYCDIEGKTPGKEPIGFTSTKAIFALDEGDAIKICLNKIEAMSFGEEGGQLVLVGLDKAISDKGVKIDKVSVRKGQMEFKK